MTSVMLRDYGQNWDGRRRFAINRALRLFPSWWCIALISGGIIASLGTPAAQNFSANMGLPTTVSGWISNLTLIFPNVQPDLPSPKISPPAWTLTVELVFYAIIGLGASRTLRRSLIWAGIGLIYIGATYALGLDTTWRYGAIMAGALPFAMGAILYHWNISHPNRLKWIRNAQNLGALIGICAANALFMALSSANLDGFAFGLFFHANLVLQGALILNLLGRTATSRMKGIDRICGDLSYPVYLLHIPIAFALNVVVFGRSDRIYDMTSLWLFILCVIVSSFIGHGIVRWVDRPIQRLRDRVRPARPAS